MADDKKIKVLIVDDVAETRENIRKLLQFEPDVEVVGAAGTGREAVQIAGEIKPDVVLMDINMPDMDGITATEMIRRNDPTMQVVILSVQGDPNYMRRAMLAGARDFLTKPPALDDLNSAIRRAGKMAHEERAKAAPAAQAAASALASLAAAAPQGKVILVYSPKGGAGATTVAVNLAVTLQNVETPVALVDGNLQFGDVAVFLNEQVRTGILDLAPRADELDAEIAQEVMISHAASGIKVLAAPTRPEYADNVTGEQFAKVVRFLAGMFSYVVVDASSILTDVILATMDISDLIVLITTQDIPAIKNARLFMDLADGLKIARKRIVFVMNRFDKRIGITAEKVGESLKHEVVAVIPFDDRIVVPSVNRGVPFIIGSANRTQPIGRSMLGLAEAVRQRLAELSSQEALVSIKR